MHNVMSKHCHIAVRELKGTKLKHELLPKILKRNKDKNEEQMHTNKRCCVSHLSFSNTSTKDCM